MMKTEWYRGRASRKNGGNTWSDKLFTHRWYHITLCRRKRRRVPINTRVRIFHLYYQGLQVKCLGTAWINKVFIYMEIKNEGMRHKELNFMNWRIDIFGRSLLLRVVHSMLFAIDYKVLQGPPYILARHTMAIFFIMFQQFSKSFFSQNKGLGIVNIYI